MKQNIKIFILSLVFAPVIFNGLVAAPCSKANITRCLDSACAINIGANPAARCQLCGTQSAGSSETSDIIQLSVATSTKYALNKEELKNAPSDPGKRYAWATAECIKKVENCTKDDISSTYDVLIEQSCKAAGLNSQFTILHEKDKTVKTRTSCEADINNCILNTKQCGPDFKGCRTDENFDKHFATCAINFNDCFEYISDKDGVPGIKTSVLLSKNSSIQGQEKAILSVASSYQASRNLLKLSVENACNDSAAKKACVKQVCELNMPNKCLNSFSSEKSMADLLCGFHDTACQRVRK